MRQPQKIQIGVLSSDERRASFSIPADSNIEDYKQLFTTILTFLTFAPETIKDILPDEEH